MIDNMLSVVVDPIFNPHRRDKDYPVDDGKSDDSVEP